MLFQGCHTRQCVLCLYNVAEWSSQSSGGWSWSQLYAAKLSGGAAVVVPLETQSEAGRQQTASAQHVPALDIQNAFHKEESCGLYPTVFLLRLQGELPGESERTRRTRQVQTCQLSSSAQVGEMLHPAIPRGGVEASGPRHPVRQDWLPTALSAGRHTQPGGVRSIHGACGGHHLHQEKCSHGGN